MSDPKPMQVRQVCPACQTDLANSINMSGARAPVERDLAVCVGCGATLVFDKNLELEIAPEALLAKLDAPSRAHLNEVSRQFAARARKGRPH